MSTTATAPEAVQLPDAVKASAVMDQLHDHALIGRFQELTGWQLNEKQAAAVIEAGIQLDLAEQEAQAKQASSSGDFFATGLDRLYPALERRGLNVGQKQAAAQTGIKQAAAALMEDSELFTSALSVAVALSNDEG